MTSKKFTHQIVCVGLAELEGGKVRPQFKRVHADGVGEERLQWVAVKHAQPGGVYEAESTSDWNGDERPIYVAKNGRLTWLRHWPNRDDRAAWEAAYDATKTAVDAEKLRAASEKQSVLEEMVAPIARVYAKLGYAQRDAFLLNLQQAIIRLARKVP